MAVAATGPISLPLANLRALIAASSSFQTWVGAASAAEALASIYQVGVDKGDYTRPFALVRHTNPGALTHESLAGGARNHFAPAGEGSLEVVFEDEVASGNEDSHVDAEFAFTNNVGAVLADMETTGATGAYLVMHRWTVAFGPARAHPDEKQSEGDYYQIVIRVDWGT